jgi:hypothetical protein
MNRLPLLFLLLNLFPLLPSQAAQVVVITHGYNSDAGDWVKSMADQMADYTAWWGETASCYQITVATNLAGQFAVSSGLIGGVPADQSTSGNIIVKLDWSNVAGGIQSIPFQIYNAPYATDVIAEAVVPKLLDVGFIADIQGHALAELPLHFVGHSRGGSLISEMARLLGAEGIEVDQLTFLDPHPCVGNVFPDSLGCPVFDPQPTLFTNVRFADNFYQINNDPFELNGQSVVGAYNRRLTSLGGGYGSEHSNTHLWYHGTIDLGSPASDGLASITAQNRSSWYAAGETNGTWSGFLYSGIGGGNQSSTNQPLGAVFPAIEAGVLGTRQPLVSNSRSWPNLLELKYGNDGFDYPSEPGLAMRREGVVSPGGLVSLGVGFTHSSSMTDSISYYLDQDANPINSLGSLLATDDFAESPGQPSATFTRNIELTNAPSYGLYYVVAVIGNGTKQRIRYSKEKIAVLPPLQLALQRNGTFEIHGAEGYGAIVEQSQTFGVWEPAGTFLFPDITLGNPHALEDTINLVGPRNFFRGQYFRP